jgi:hypothetical protein
LRDVMAAELERRRRGNPRYSLRRFARFVGLHHATVLRVLGGRLATERTVRAVARRIGIDAADVARILASEDATAIVLAIGRPDFRPDSRWLATRTGLSIDRVNVVLQDLLRTGGLRMVAAGTWLVAEGETA